MIELTSSILTNLGNNGFLLIANTGTSGNTSGIVMGVRACDNNGGISISTSTDESESSSGSFLPSSP